MMKITIPKSRFESVSSIASYDAALRSVGISEGLDAETLEQMTKGSLKAIGLGSSRRKPSIRSSEVNLPDDALDDISSSIMPNTQFSSITVYDIDRTGPYFIVGELPNGTYHAILYSKSAVK